jgi:hypothetical protein
MHLGMMLKRIYAMYERRAAILAFTVIINTFDITIGVVRRQMSPSTISEDNNAQLGIVQSSKKKTPDINFHCNTGLTTEQYANF